MDIKNLPGASHNFRVSTGAGSFSKKFNSAVRVGSLHNLADNKDSIIKAIKTHEGDIRIGKFDRLRQLSTYNKIKKMEGGRLTKEDKSEIKQILKHLGGGDKSETKSDSLAEEGKMAAAETKPAVPVKVRINRDPNNQYDFKKIRENVRSGVGDKGEAEVKPRFNNTGLAGSLNRLKPPAGSSPANPVNPFHSAQPKKLI